MILILLPSIRAGLGKSLFRRPCVNSRHWIASLIKEGHIVVLNLERCGSVESQKLLDFISGASYAREYKMNKIAVSTYLIAPPEVAIISLID